MQDIISRYVAITICNCYYQAVYVYTYVYMKMYTYIFEMGYLSDCVPVQPAPAVPYNGNSCNYEQCVDYKSFLVSLSTKPRKTQN